MTNLNEFPVSVEVLKWGDSKSDFCLINLYTPSLHNPIAFTFNMEYFIEMVANEHQAMFLQDVFFKMLIKEKIDYCNIETIDYSKVILEIKNIWNENHFK
jgi:hypothetical protein